MIPFIMDTADNPKARRSKIRTDLQLSLPDILAFDQHQYSKAQDDRRYALQRRCNQYDFGRSNKPLFDFQRSRQPTRICSKSHFVPVDRRVITYFYYAEDLKRCFSRLRKIYLR